MEKRCSVCNQPFEVGYYVRKELRCGECHAAIADTLASLLPEEGKASINAFLDSIEDD